MNPGQPALSELTARYLNRQSSAHTEGLGIVDVSEDVVPHDTVPVQPVEPRLAWTEAQAVLEHFPLGTEKHSTGVPADWSSLVAAHESEIALPFCLGNYPQLVRYLPALLQTTTPAGPPAPGLRPLASSSLLDWTRHVTSKKQGMPALLAAGVLRLARQYDEASATLQGCRPHLPATLERVWANEEAALLWHQGKTLEADSRWAKQTESVPVLFNRGVARLFLGKPEEARGFLQKAADGLPEASAWHHLARLYGALAEMRMS